MRQVVGSNMHGPITDYSGIENEWQKHCEVLRDLNDYLGDDRLEEVVLPKVIESLREEMARGYELLDDQIISVSCMFIEMAICARGAYAYEVYHAAIEHIVWN